MILPSGTPAPLFSAPTPDNPDFYFGSLGGMFILLAFLPAPGPQRNAALDGLKAYRHIFDDRDRTFIGVLPDEASFKAVQNLSPGVRWMADLDGRLRERFGLVNEAGELTPSWVLVDPMLRMLGASPISDLVVLARLAASGPADAHAGTEMSAPVLVVPRVFEPEFCTQLIAAYQADGGTPSGVMQEKNGLTIGVMNDMKRRRDLMIEDETLRAEIRMRLQLRLLPEIHKAFQFVTSHAERYLVGCYDANDGGYFRPHRDNESPGTAHRQFAVTINLNAGKYEGGELVFPEFGRRSYAPPTGAAVVFSCSLLHEVRPVTLGQRYAFLPFLYDEAGERIRQKNQPLVAADAYENARGAA